ncbi:hypothetical protein [Litoreibacter roseus]|nr:hypothetical protein [Litoreibacter roseus]
MKKLFCLTAAAMLAVVATDVHAATKKVTRTVQVDEEFPSANLRWTGAHAGGYDMMWRPIMVDGKIEICAAGAYTNIQLRQAVRKSLKGGTVSMNDKVILKDLTFSASARTANRIRSTKANCVATGVTAPKKIDGFMLEFGPSVFRN